MCSQSSTGNTNLLLRLLIAYLECLLFSATITLQKTTPYTEDYCYQINCHIKIKNVLSDTQRSAVSPRQQFELLVDL